jgi:hypothetical protein
MEYLIQTQFHSQMEQEQQLVTLEQVPPTPTLMLNLKLSQLMELLTLLLTLAVE